MCGAKGFRFGANTVGEKGVAQKVGETGASHLPLCTPHIHMNANKHIRTNNTNIYTYIHAMLIYFCSGLE